MVYRSLTSPENKDYRYDIKIAHLYGNLMNTYGDNGNVLMLKYVAEKLGTRVEVDIVSLEDDFDKDSYDIVFFGGGQDYEQTIVARDLPAKKEALESFINENGVVLAICGGFQLLGQYYIEASGRRIEGLGIMGHYTLNQTKNRYIGDIKIHNEEFNETYYGFENHQGRTFLLTMKNLWARSSMEMATTKRMVAKAFIIKMSLAPTSTALSCHAMRIWPTVW